MPRFARRAASALFTLRERLTDWLSHRPAVRRLRRWLAVERLEDRTTPATITWANAAGGSWHTPGNWDLNRLPAAGDDVVIPDLVGAQTITFTTGSTSVTSVQTAEALSLGGGELTVNGDLSATVPVSLTGATLNTATLPAGTTLSALSGTLDGVTVAGAMTVAGGGSLSVQNGLTVNGTADLGVTQAGGQLRFVGTQTLGGSGVVRLVGHPTDGLAVMTAGTTLTVGAGVTVRGPGGFIGHLASAGVGSPTGVVRNLGTITAGPSVGFPLEITPFAWVNQGTVGSESGGVLSLRNAVANAGGLVSVADGGVVSAFGELTAGTVAGAGSAQLLVWDGALNGVTLAGPLRLGGQSAGQGGMVPIRNGLTVNGLVRLAADNSLGQLWFEGTQTLGGAGTVEFVGNDSRNGVAVVQADTTLTIGAGVTVKNPVYVGYSTGAGSTNGYVNNFGVVLAEGTNRTVPIPASRWGGAGVLRSVNGGIINFRPGTLANAGSTLILDGNGLFELAGMTVSGGTVRVTGGANVRAASGTLDGVTVDGDMSVGEGNVLVVRNGLTLNGTLWVGGATRGVVHFDGSQTLGGTGNMRFSNYGGFPFNQVAAGTGQVLTVGPGVTIQAPSGFGLLGTVDSRVVIHGTVFADGAAGRVQIRGNGWTAPGTLRATNGGTITLSDTVANSGTFMTLDGNGRFEIQGATVSGGTVRMTGGAILNATSGTLDRVTADGDLAVATGNAMTVRNGLTLNGTARLGAGATSGSMHFQGSQTLGGTGVVQFVGYADSSVHVLGTGNVLTVGPGVTVRASGGATGTLGSNDTGVVIRGTVHADGATNQVTIRGTNWTAPGTLRATNGGVIAGAGTFADYAAGTLTGGTYIVGANSTIRLPIGALSVFGASVWLDGANSQFQRGDGQPALQGTLAVGLGGVLSVNTGGTLSLASLQVDGSVVILPGSTVAVTGTYRQTATGTLELVVGGTPASGLFGRLTAGTAELAGRIRTTFANRFGPTIGQAFAVLTYGTRTGTFATADTPFFGVGYEPTAVVLNATATAGDLAVTTVSGPPAAAPGQAITVTYAVENRSSAPISGAWQDSIYLSADGVYDSSDLLLTRVMQTRTLAAGDSYTETITITLPASAAGAYRLLVVTDSRGQVADTDRANNSRAATTITSLAVPALTLGIPRVGTVRNGESVLFRLDLSAGRNVTVRGTFGGANQAELYVRYGQAPTRSVYDFAANSLAELQREILIRGPQAGPYYILLYGREGAFTPVPFTLLADFEALRVSAASPNSIWADGDATITLSGAALPANARVFLSFGGVEREAGRVNVRDAGTLFATFDTRGWALGRYSVRGFNPTTNTSATLADAVTVTIENPLRLTLTRPPVSPRPAIRISSPTAIRVGGSGIVTVDFANESGFDQPAPLILVSADNADLRLRGDTQYAGQSVQVLGINTTGEAGTLPPGYRGTLQLEFRARNFNTITFTASQPLADTSPIDWAAVKNDLRPAYIAPDAWDAIYTVFLTQVGSTAGQYARVLADNATALSNLGVFTPDVARLLAFELQQASAQLPSSSLASAVDASAPVPGLPLAFGRTYAQPIAGRYAVGALGRGWSHAWELTAATDADGNVTLQNAGSARFFRKSGGSFIPTAGDYATLTLSGGANRLRETDGSVFQFRPDGKLEHVEDTNGNRVTAAYAGGQLTQLTHSSGAAFTLAYHPSGRLATLTDQAGRVTTYAYDGTGQYLLSVTGPRGTTAYGYETAGPLPQRHALRTITDPTGASVAFVYDAAGRLIRQEQTGGTQAVTFAYDSAAGLTVRDQTGAEVRLSFDDGGQLRKVIDPLGNASRFGFDAAGNLTGANAPQGLSSTFGYDARGNPTTVTDPLGNAIGTTFDPAFDRLTSLTNANGGRLAYGYDARGNLTSITYTDGSRETFTYDAAGNVRSSTNRRGQTIGYAYDARGLLTQKVTPEETTTYGYDTRGNLTSATSPLGTWVLTYDTADRLTRYEQPGGRFLQFTYDAAGRRTRSVDQDGAAVNYRYDAQGRLAELTDAADARIVLYAYDTAGRLARKDNGNSTFTQYGYDTAGRLVELVNRQPDGDVNSSFAYAYDSLGRQTAVTDETGGVTRYGYDATGQLTRVELPTGRVIEYHYDRNGNRTDVIDGGEVTDYTTNTLDQYTAVGADALSYDRDGNLTSEVGPGTARAYQYTSENRLVALTDGAVSSAFEYDPFGNRVAVVANGVRTEYQIDPAGLGNVVAEFGAGGPVKYTHGIGLTSRTAAGSTNFYDFNYVGSTVGLTDAAGGYSNRYAYLPFGERLAATEGVANDFEYVGQWGVMKSGATEYMRARYYLNGEFIQDDPIGVAGSGTNQSAYAANNPVSFSDPSGLVLWDQFVDGVLNIATGAGIAIASGAALAAVGATTPVWLTYGVLAAGVVGWGYILGGAHQIDTAVANQKFDYGLGALYDALSDDPNAEMYGDAIELGFAPPKAIVPLIKPVYRAIGSIVDQLERGKFLIEYDDELLSLTRTPQFNSADPNDILNPTGVGPGKHVAAEQTLAYTIRFENLASATAAAAQVVITHTLDDDLDLSSFALGEVGFGGAFGTATSTVAVPGGRAVYATRLDLRATLGIFADVSADLNLTTRVVTWTLTAIDPLTGDIPADPALGLLPPNDSTGRGEGYVTFTVRAKPGTPSGSRIDAQARIVFDTNAPIDTPSVFNTIDAGPPDSAVSTLPTETTQTAFTISWAGQDESGGVGVATYDVFVSADGGAYALWLDDTTLTSAVYPGAVGHTYRFFSTATDLVEHEELPPETADAIITVVEPPPVPPPPGPPAVPPPPVVPPVVPPIVPPPAVPPPPMTPLPPGPPPPVVTPVVVRHLPVGGRGSSVVRLREAVTGAEVRAFDAFPGFTAGANVATGDVTGDGVADLFVGAAAGGGPHVKLFDGAKLLAGATPGEALVFTFFAYDLAFTGGVNVALGDVTGDGRLDLITGAGAGGGPHVKVFDGATAAIVSSFMAYDVAFAGGVSVSAADFNGDGKADIITGAGPGGGPHVKVIDAAHLGERRADGVIANSALLSSFYAYEVAFLGGVSVTTGDTTGDGRPEAITGAGAGGGPHVKAFDIAWDAATGFFAFDADDHDGVSVAYHHTPAGPRLFVGSLGSGGLRQFTPPAFTSDTEWPSDELNGAFVG